MFWLFGICRDRRPRRTSSDVYLYSKSSPFKNQEEDNLPFSLDEDSNVLDGSPPVLKKSPLRSAYGFSLDADVAKGMEVSSRYNKRPDNNLRSSERNLKESFRSIDHRTVNTRSKGMLNYYKIYTS